MLKINHIGLIPDGNRRWADENSLDYSSAYNISMNNIAKFIQYVSQIGINSLSIYMLSKENLNRKRDDIDAVLEAETRFVRTILPTLINKTKYSMIHVGDKSTLPEELRKALKDVLPQSSQLSKKRLYLLIGYNPIDEINYAISSKSSKFKIENLWVPEKVDIVIRTAGGPTLLSNFLPLQCGYAQIYMIEKYFNDFTKEDFNSILYNASRSNMAYGK